MLAMTATEEHAGQGAGTAWRLAAVACSAGVLLAVAWWMTGPAPTPVDAGLPKSPPPMTVPIGMAKDAPVASAIGELAKGSFVAATNAFTTLVAEAPDDPVAQTGLILAEWRSDGPIAVEHDLSQLAQEQPDSSYVALHLGLVRVLIDESDGAETAFNSAVALGRAEGDATGLRMARLADDLLHPDGFRSYVPVLVQPSDVPIADRPALRRLLHDVERDDRVGAARDAKVLAASRSGMAHVASIVGRYEKGKEADTQRALAAVAASAVEPAAVRSRATLHQGLAQLWSGSDSDAGCDLLVRASGSEADIGTRRLATSISAELCR